MHGYDVSRLRRGGRDTRIAPPESLKNGISSMPRAPRWVAFGSPRQGALAFRGLLSRSV